MKDELRKEVLDGLYKVVKSSLECMKRYGEPLPNSDDKVEVIVRRERVQAAKISRETLAWALKKIEELEEEEVEIEEPRIT